jgi:EAL domain-containing protein (putative c-di-GMP-specific phosphodiesterase class I)
MSDGVLLKASNDRWIEKVRAAAVIARLGRVEQVRSKFEAINRLLAGDREFSHLLIAAEDSRDGIFDLLSLTTAEEFPKPSPLVLGLAPEEIPWVPAIAGGDAGSIAAMLSACTDAPAGPELAIELDEISGASLYDVVTTRYQPIVRMRDGIPCCIEVLARFNHRKRGVLSPETFLTHVERTGRADEFTTAVIGRGLEGGVGSSLQSRGVSVAFNLPIEVFFASRMVARLDEQCRAAGVDPRNVIIELTERRPDVDLTALTQAVIRLRTRGYGVAIDDFGPTTCQHQALLDLPFTSLKLDMGLVRRTSERGAASDFAARTIEHAKRNGMTVVVEGVEDAATWARMAALGADQAQGFAIARPLPAAALPIWFDLRHDQPFQTSW